MTKLQKSYNRDSICFKEQAVQRWIRRFGREELLNKVIRIEMKSEKGMF
jgi:hypothetical protein